MSMGLVGGIRAELSSSPRIHLDIFQTTSGTCPRQPDTSTMLNKMRVRSMCGRNACPRLRLCAPPSNQARNFATTKRLRSSVASAAPHTKLGGGRGEGSRQSFGWAAEMPRNERGLADVSTTNIHQADSGNALHSQAEYALFLPASFFVLTGRPDGSYRCETCIAPSSAHGHVSDHERLRPGRGSPTFGVRFPSS